MNKKKIVIIEDDQIVCRHLIRSFVVTDYTLHLVTNQTQLRRLVQNGLHDDADIFICDVMMEHGNIYETASTFDGNFTGIAVAADLRKRCPQTPIIFWSSFPEKSIRNEVKRAVGKISNCGELHKKHYIDGLIAAIDHYFKTGRFKLGLIDRLWARIQITPTIGWIGIDLKDKG